MRTTTVARSENQVASNLASDLAYDEAGIREGELLDNPDHTAGYGASDGLTCAERDGLIVPIGNVGKSRSSIRTGISGWPQW